MIWTKLHAIPVVNLFVINIDKTKYPILQEVRYTVENIEATWRHWVMVNFPQ